MKNLHIALDSEQHRKLKIAAAMRGISVTQLVITALNPTIGTVTKAHVALRPTMESAPLVTR